MARQQKRGRAGGGTQGAPEPPRPVVIALTEVITAVTTTAAMMMPAIAPVDRPSSLSDLFGDGSGAAVALASGETVGEYVSPGALGARELGDEDGTDVAGDLDGDRDGDAVGVEVGENVSPMCVGACEVGDEDGSDVVGATVGFGVVGAGVVGENVGDLVETVGAAVGELVTIPDPAVVGEPVVFPDPEPPGPWRRSRPTTSRSISLAS